MIRVKSPKSGFIALVRGDRIQLTIGLHRYFDVLLVAIVYLPSGPRRGRRRPRKGAAGAHDGWGGGSVAPSPPFPPKFGVLGEFINFGPGQMFALALIAVLAPGLSKEAMTILHTGRASFPFSAPFAAASTPSR